MELWKIEGRFVDFHNGVAKSFDYMLTDETLDNIVNKTLPNYIKSIKSQYEDPNDEEGCMLNHVEVSKLPMNRNIIDGDFLEKYVYLPDCSLYVERKYDTFTTDSFKGRKPEDRKINKGDIVYCIGSDYVCSGIVYSEPPEPGRFQNLDAMDDSYVVLEGMFEFPEKISSEIYGKYHMHVEVDSIFKRK